MVQTERDSESFHELYQSLRWKVRELAFHLRSICFQTILSEGFSLPVPFSNPYGMVSLWSFSLSFHNKSWSFLIKSENTLSLDRFKDLTEKFLLNNECFSEHCNDPFLFLTWLILISVNHNYVSAPLSSNIVLLEKAGVVCSGEPELEIGRSLLAHSFCGFHSENTMIRRPTSCLTCSSRLNSGSQRYAQHPDLNLFGKESLEGVWLRIMIWVDPIFMIHHIWDRTGGNVGQRRRKAMRTERHRLK